MDAAVVEVGVITVVSLALSWEVRWRRPHSAARRAADEADMAFWRALREDRDRRPDWAKAELS